MSTLAMVRGLGLRPFDIEFYKNCKDLYIKFLHCTDLDIERWKSSNMEFIKLEIKPVFPFDPVSAISGKYHLISWAYLKDLEKSLESVDFIHTLETHFFLSRQCAEISKNQKKPLIINVAQNLLNHPSRFLPPYSFNTKKVIKEAYLFIALTERAKLYLKSLSINDERIKVIYPGVNLHIFYPARKWVKNSARPRILFVGNLTPTKGIYELLEAYTHLCHKVRKEPELWICGKGNMEPIRKKYVKYPIKYLGFIDHEKLPEIYRQCDVFCVPSRAGRIFGISWISEQVGFVFLEAMASGLPIVTTNCGSIPEIVGPKNIIVRQSSVKQLYIALKTLILNEEMRYQIGRSNRVRAEKLFDLRKQCNKFQDEVKKLV